MKQGISDSFKELSVVFEQSVSDFFLECSWSSLFHTKRDGLDMECTKIREGTNVNLTNKILNNSFILAAEVLGRALDALFDNPDFICFGMPKWSYNINYLSYADDTISFCSSHYGAVQLIMNVLEEYEAASGQKINKEKSSFYMHEDAPADKVNTIHLIIEFQRHPFPFTYLGCPIFYSRRKKDFYKNIIFKVQERLSSWNGKLLSIGGRAVLISHVLETMQIHPLSAVNPPPYVINQLHKMFARFYWSNTGNGRARHWASWENLCLSKSERGLGFRSLHDVSTTLFAKLWWNYRTNDSLWFTFMRNKYCRKINEVVVPWRHGSHVWRKMLQMRDEVEYQVWWQLKSGNSYF
ncbi:uncharacterized protein LOC142169604 [Nicotiana tabacum]|uniref:Uncharacterized protein LOC142169604 n=1 Tax=Nicotiana tabacum TaxID=4097 RepID=A0AC58SRJ4_TOBAC